MRSSVSAVRNCCRSSRGKRSEVWRRSSGRCESGLRLSGACQMEAQGDKAEESQKELQGQGASRGREHVRTGSGRSRTGLRCAGVHSGGIDNAGDVLGWLQVVQGVVSNKGLASACVLHHCYPLYPIWGVNAAESMWQLQGFRQVEGEKGETWK
jgi:hypothetical protein